MVVLRVRSTLETSKMADYKTEKRRERIFAIVLADIYIFIDETQQFAVRLDTLALKKSANNDLFQEISEAFKSYLLSEELKEENQREVLKKTKPNSKRIDFTSVCVVAAILNLTAKYDSNP